MREKDSGGSCSSHTPATHATGSAAVSVPQWSALSTIDVIATISGKDKRTKQLRISVAFHWTPRS